MFGLDMGVITIVIAIVALAVTQMIILQRHGERIDKLRAEMHEGHEKLRREFKADIAEAMAGTKSMNKNLTAEIKTVDENLMTEIKAINENLWKLDVRLSRVEAQQELLIQLLREPLRERIRERVGAQDSD